jgi:ATP-dependent Zn protease
MTTLTMRQAERLAISTHEAGHALVSLALGLDVSMATILADEDSTGHIELVDPDAGSLADRASVRLASHEALVAYGELTPETERGCAKDLREARAFALASTNGDESAADELLAELRSKVREIIFDRSADLGAIALALLEHWTLTGSELKELISP